MSNRKNYNSIVFLTTLSVYLGLVLVGGSTPSVLAQAATTRDFDIKSEIVVEDDLDKKPDDEKLDFAGSLDNYFNEVEDFVKELQKLHKSGKFNLDRDSFELSRQVDVACNVDGDPVATTTLSEYIENRILKRALTESISVLKDREYLSDCLKDKQSKKAFTTNSKLKLFYDNSQLKIEISAPKLTKQRAEFLAERFNQAYSLYRTDEREPAVKTIYENTSFNAENNQVFIVTRLPRASIDALLAENSAQ